MGCRHPWHLPDQPQEVHPWHQDGELVYMRGNSMYICGFQVFAGLKKKKDRDSLIAYLEESTAWYNLYQIPKNCCQALISTILVFWLKPAPFTSRDGWARAIPHCNSPNLDWLLSLKGSLVLSDLWQLVSNLWSSIYVNSWRAYYDQIWSVWSLEAFALVCIYSKHSCPPKSQQVDPKPVCSDILASVKHSCWNTHLLTAARKSVLFYWTRLEVRKFWDIHTVHDILYEHCSGINASQWSLFVNTEFII